MNGELKRIGILTGGGDCPGLNAVIRAVVKTAVYQHRLNVVGIEDGFLGLIENHMRPLTAGDVTDLLTRGGTILGTTNKADPSRYPVAADGRTEFRDVTDRCLERLKEHAIDALIIAGGDGTMTAAAALARQGVNIIGVPKTIDNDLVGTDITFGFDTAVHVATEALDRIHTTAASHHRAMIVELMGRRAGWIALHAGLASGADVILIPEIPYELEKVCATIHRRAQFGKRFTLLAAAEGAHPRGQETVALHDPRYPDPVRLGGIGRALAEQIEQATGVECRCTVLGHVQRGGTPTANDRILATDLGFFALKLLMSGQRGRLVIYRDGKINHIDLGECAGRQRTVPQDHPLLQAARAVGTSFGD